MTTSPTSFRVAQQVSGLMAKAEISQQKLANETGIPLPTLRRRLLGLAHQSFSITELEAIASFLNVTISELLQNEATS